MDKENERVIYPPARPLRTCICLNNLLHYFHMCNVVMIMSILSLFSVSVFSPCEMGS